MDWYRFTSELLAQLPSVGVHQEYMWHQNTFGSRLIIDFVVISDDILPCVLDNQGKRGTKLFPDYHLVVSWIHQ